MELDDQIDNDFDAGFSEDTVTPTEKPETTEAPAEPAPQAPKYAQITEEQYQHLLSRATAIDEIKAAQEKQFGTAFGKIGGIERLVNQLQAAAPAGQSIEVSEDDFDELRADFPELAAMQVKGLNKALAKVRGSGPAVDPEMLEQRIQERLAPEIQRVREEASQKIVDLTIRQQHRDWNKVVRSPEFAEWLAAKPQAERDAIQYSDDPDVVADHITTFKAAAKAATTRAKRFDQAVTPRGTGGHAPAPDDDDEFNAGFNGR